MSMDTWKAAFYPVSAVGVLTWREGLEHSYNKWVGLLPENLKKHFVVCVDAYDRSCFVVREKDDVLEEDIVRIDITSCALCHISGRKTPEENANICDKCVLTPRCNYQWKIWSIDKDPDPMIALLQANKEKFRG